MKSELRSGVMSIDEAARACGGRVVRVGEPRPFFSALCTDSREGGEGVLFVADVGERADGHDYMASAMALGTRHFLCSRIPDGVYERGEPFAAIVTEHPFLAIAPIAALYRERVKPLCVAVTGSVGKTTTKEFVWSVLSRLAKTHKTEGNFNSVVGMPMSLFSLEPDDRATVLEMGMSARGEIAHMTRAAAPDMAIITNVGNAHIELLGSRENICRAKFEIAEGLGENGLLILNGDDPYQREYADRLTEAKKVWVAIEWEGADLRATHLRSDAAGTVFDVVCAGRVYSDVRIPMTGTHAVYDALFAVAVGMGVKLEFEDIRRGLAGFKTVGMRQNIYALGGVTVIEDCYNANPESMTAALEVLASLTPTAGGRRIAVLGDMRELGEGAPAFHEALGRQVAEKGIDYLFAYGPMAVHMARGAREGGLPAHRLHVNADVAAPEVTGEVLRSLLGEGDVMLVKASRSVAAECIIEYIKENGTWG